MEINNTKKITAKEKIILSAETLFASAGYADTSVNRIIEQAKVSKGAFYHHFNAKEDLITAIIDYEHSRIQTVPAEVTSSSTPQEKFKDEMTRWFQSLEDTKHLLPWMVPLMAHPPMKSKFQAMEPEKEKVKAYLVHLLSEIKFPNVKVEAEMLYYFFGGLKMELSMYPNTDLTSHKATILKKYLKNQ